MTILLPTSPPLPGATAVLDFNNAIKALKGNTQTAFNAAATVDIGSTDTVNILINGNTAITSFGANANLMQDEFRFVRFSGTPLITHNGTSLICPNGTSIPVKANDAALLQYLGSGNWRVYAYFPATSGSRLALTADTTFYVRTAPAAISFTNGSANVTWTGHGLSANDPVVVDVLPSPTYATITNANPGVVTYNAHGFAAGQPIKFESVGYLPPGVVAGTTYYVIATGLTANTFQFSATVGGAAVNTSKLSLTASNDGSGNLLITATAHGLIQGQIISFANTGGALPGGLSASTIYYVVATNLAANTFSVSAVSGPGTMVAFSSAGSGTNTLEQTGGSSSYLFGSNTATHRCSKVGAMPTFSTAGLLVAGTVYYVGTVVDGNNITLSTTLNNANPAGTATVASGSPQYTAVTGNDANGGLTQTRSGALLTLQHAMDVLSGQYDFGGKNVAIQMGSSTFRDTNGCVNINPWVGGGTLTLQGDQTYPPNATINSSSGSGIGTVSCVMIQNGALPGPLFVKGFKVTSTPASAAGFYLNTSCQVYPANIELGAIANQSVTVQAGAYFSAEGNLTISGGTANVFQANPGGTIFETGGRAMNATLLNMPTFSNFVRAQLGGTATINVGQALFFGGGIGAKYSAVTNGVVQHNASPNGYPGTIAGSTATGGQAV